MLSSSVLTAVGLALFVLGVFGAGYLVADWRSGEEIERLRGDNTLLAGANNRCVRDLKAVNQAVGEVLNLAQEREKQAQDAMKEAQPVIERKKAKVIQIRALPAVAPDQQCEAIRAEQVSYVQFRKDAE